MFRLGGKDAMSCGGVLDPEVDTYLARGPGREYDPILLGGLVGCVLLMAE